jgi:hypothetical protein
MIKIRLNRTGDAPLRFDGEEVASSDGQRQGGRDRNRWHDLAVYRVADDRYVVAIAYRTQWQGELDHHAAVIVATAAEVAQVLRDHDPCGHLAGYPAGPQYADRQVALARDVRSRYETQVSDVLDADEFAVGIEPLTNDRMVGQIVPSDTGPDSDGDCPKCGHPADNSSGHGTCDHPCHRSVG